MLTIFACPRAFQGHFAVIQRNAIRSWTLLQPQPEVLLLGDDPGTHEAAQEMGLRHEPGIMRNECGTPLVNDLFARAEQLGENQLLCYVNADIILTNGFMHAVAQVARLEGRFLMVGRRWDVDIQEELIFDPGWEDRLWAQVSSKGQVHSLGAIDFFVFPRGLWDSIPPFALGRWYFDNWLLYRARSLNAWLIDATPVTTVIHQNHPRSPQSRQTAEAHRNLELAGGRWHLYALDDATHRLTARGVEPLRLLERGVREAGRWRRMVRYEILERTHPLRRRFGLARS